MPKSETFAQPAAPERASTVQAAVSGTGQGEKAFAKISY